MRINVGYIWPTPKSFIRAVSLLPDRNGHRVFSLECSVCSQDSELWPPGNIVGKVTKLNRGVIPCGCSANPKWSTAQNVVRARRAAASTGLRIEKWLTPSRLLLTCIAHGPLEKSLKHLVTGGTGCLACWHEALRLPATEVSRRLTERQAETGVQVLSRTGSRLKLKCPQHGEYETSIDAFVRQKCGCPSCAFGGFKPHKRAALYVLKSDCNGYIKVGISGSIKRRMQKLHLQTPFYFTLEKVVRLNGFKALQLEKLVHDTFESAGLCKFDGATEWLKANPAILTFIQTDS